MDPYFISLEKNKFALAFSDTHIDLTVYVQRPLHSSHASGGHKSCDDVSKLVASMKDEKRTCVYQRGL
jgi:hypothetical protein